MQIALNSGVRRWGLLVAALPLAVLFLGCGAREFLAAHYSSAPEVEKLQLAIRLSPANAEYHQQMGRYLFQVGDDIAAALRQYQMAVQLNPHDAQSWLELAALDQTINDIPAQREALRHAVQADPTTPEVAWEAGNFFLVRGETQKALREFRVVIENEPNLAYEALQLCVHAADVDTVLQQAVPPQPDAYLKFIDLLTALKDTAGAAKAWAGLVQLGKPFETRSALQYVNYLILQQEVRQARLVWLQTAELCGLTAYLSSHDNVVVNAGLDSDILNNGFDWHYRKESGVELALDPIELHNGHRSLSVIFDGPGVNELGMFQFIPVEPDTEYEFSAYYKSDSIEGAGGPRFTITDAYSGATYFLSDDLKDADDWRESSGRFKTSPDAQLVTLRLIRIPAGGAIRGKLWASDFRLVAKQP